MTLYLGADFRTSPLRLITNLYTIYDLVSTSIYNRLFIADSDILQSSRKGCELCFGCFAPKVPQWNFLAVNKVTFLSKIVVVQSSNQNEKVSKSSCPKNTTDDSTCLLHSNSSATSCSKICQSCSTIESPRKFETTILV